MTPISFHAIEAGKRFVEEGFVKEVYVAQYYKTCPWEGKLLIAKYEKDGSRTAFKPTGLKLLLLDENV